jgi:repressor LexA
VIRPPLSAVARVMQIGVTSDEMSLQQLSTIAYWKIRARLLRVPGVVNVAIWGERLQQDHVNVDPALFRPAADFLLRVRGDSMKNADILDRDLLAVHRTNQARNGQIVVARIDDEATVKYYRRQGQLVRLEAANPAYAPIEIDLREQELSIEGLATGVVRTVLSRRS